jgi:radical SAM protein with 4Fe4S-binding SPASM domain
VDMEVSMSRHLPIDEAAWTARKRRISANDITEAPVPHVVAWNLTARCNLQCDHCYIAAGPWMPTDQDLSTAEVKRITDEILDINPGPMFVLTGGEPLLRKDLEEIADYGASRGATVVVGTNGTGLTENRIRSLKDAGVTGVAVSVDSLLPERHNTFRHGESALQLTLAAIERLKLARMDFIVQTTVTRENRQEVMELARWSAEHGAVSFNLYFLVPTGRGEALSTLSPDENESVLEELVGLEAELRGQMLVRSKCQPALMRLIHQQAQDSPLMNYSTRCPCGIHYCRITPDGKLTPCPYLPEVAGDLRTQSFAEVWNDSPLFQTLRSKKLKGKCGSCEYKDVCGGCRARAFAQTGDVLGPDESCAHIPSETGPAIAAGPDKTYGAPAALTLVWSEDAQERIRRIPSFVRGVVVKRTEEYATRNGHTEITAALLDQIRKDLPIDFSKKRPFFMRFGAGGEDD